MVCFLFLLLASLNSGLAQPTPQQRHGDELAGELRSSAPAQNSEVNGVLMIRSSRQKITNDIPVRCQILVSADYWDSIYETPGKTGMPAEKLVVRHFPDQPNDYFYAQGTAGPDVPLEPKLIPRAEAERPFANSDFWLTDLGMEFLHWPFQSRVKGEMRLGQACHVLESVNPGDTKIRRVVSWIDKDSANAGIAAILAAEAYDSRNKVVKEFTIRGSSFKKVEGQWQLERMEIRNPQARSTTTLKFDLSRL